MYMGQIPSPYLYYGALSKGRPTDRQISQNIAGFARRSGLTLGSLKFIIYLFIFLRPAPKTQCTHEWALELVSGSDF